MCLHWSPISVQKKYSIQVQEKEILRAEKELISSSTLPAEARAYETKLMAEASKTQKTTQAQTDAQATRLNGKAEADALEAVGKAMALEMSMKAESYASYGEAATMSLVLEKLPQIATEVARPLAKINDIVVVGGKGGMTMEATKFLAELPVSNIKLKMKTLNSVLANRQSRDWLRHYWLDWWDTGREENLSNFLYLIHTLWNKTKNNQLYTLKVRKSLPQNPIHHLID